MHTIPDSDEVEPTVDTTPDNHDDLSEHFLDANTLDDHTTFVIPSLDPYGMETAFHVALDNSVDDIAISTTYQGIMANYLGDNLEARLDVMEDMPFDKGSSEWWEALLNTQGIEGHTLSDTYTGNVVAELLAGRQVILADQLGDTFSPFPSQHHGDAMWIQSADFSDADNPQLLIANSTDPFHSGVAYPLPSLVEQWDQGQHSYYATDHPPAAIDDIASGFDQETGFFSDPMAWLNDNSPSIATAVISFAVGAGVGDILDSHAAGAVAHFVTDKGIEQMWDKDDKDK